MSAPELGRAFAFDPEAPADSRRAGLVRLLEAAPGRGIDPEDVWGVDELAWSPKADFDARRHPSYGAVLAMADEVNGYGWSEHVLVDAAGRYETFRDLTRTFVTGYTRGGRWADLTAHDKESAVHAGMMRAVHTIEGTGRTVPGWDIPGVAWTFVRWELREVRMREKRQHRAPTGRWIHLEEVLEWGDPVLHAVGGSAADGSLADSTLDAVVWAMAHRSLRAARGDVVAAARAGAPRQRAELTLVAALHVLAWGAASAGAGVRHEYALDARAVSWLGLRCAAPQTWGRYGAEVPTRETIAEMAAAMAEADDPQAAWFGAQAGRLRELCGSDRVLHGVMNVVREQLELAGGGDS